MDTLISFLEHICSKLDWMHKEIGTINQQHDKSNAEVQSQLQEMRNSFEKTNLNFPLLLSHMNTDCESSYDGISGTEEIHRECLQENLESMSKDIVLKRALVLDELVKDECLTEDEAADVREFKDRQDQTRKLVVLMGKRSAAKFIRFLEILKRSHNYPHIAEQLEELYKSKIERSRRKKECIPCFIKRDVNIKDIVDNLCTNCVVNLDFVDSTVSSDLTNDKTKDSLWRRLFEMIDFSDDRQQSLLFLKVALKSKYDHIAKKLSSAKDLKCHCKREKNDKVRFKTVEKMSYPSCSGCTDEISTTSTRHTSKLSLPSATISEGGSDISNDITDNLPRTIDWVVKQMSIENPTTDMKILEHTWPTRSIDPSKDPYDTIVSSVCGELETTKTPNMSSPLTLEQENNNVYIPKTYTPGKESPRSLISIGDGLLLAAGIDESNAYQQIPSNLAITYHTDSKSTQESNPPEKDSERNISSIKSKKAKKRRKRRSKSQNEAKQSENERGKYGNTEKEYFSNVENQQCQTNLRLCQQTLGTRPFESIPSKNVCIEHPNLSADDNNKGSLAESCIITKSKNIDPHSKLGCPGKVNDKQGCPGNVNKKQQKRADTT